MSANVLARDARVTAKTVLRIEAGTEEPSVLVALRIAEAVGLEVEDIFSLRADSGGGDVD